MTRPTIAFIRETAALTDALVASYVAAQQVQISRDFAAIWNLDAECVFVPPGQTVPPGAWQLIFNDHSAMSGALGYHTDQGNPIAYVSVLDDLADGNSWTVTASHETLEMLLDPTINQTVSVTINGVTWEYPKEACDACESDSLGYWIKGPDGRGHLMSAFMRPSWFDPAGKGPFTFPSSGAIQAPFALAPDGYTGRRETAPAPGGWIQVFADEGRVPRQIKKPSSRTMRRFGVVPGSGDPTSAA